MKKPLAFLYPLIAASTLALPALGGAPIVAPPPARPFRSTNVGLEQFFARANVGYTLLDDGRNYVNIFGYRALGVDYSDGGFLLDVVTHGPFLGLMFEF